MVSTPPSGNTVPFEDTSLPFPTRFFRTVGLTFSDPTRLFSGMPAEGIGAPLLYGMIIGTIVILFSMIWNMMFGGLAMLAEGAEAEEFVISTGLYAVILVLSPFFALLGLFVSTALYHVALLILGDGQRGFAVTFRAIAYGGTPTLLGIVPLCGGLVGGIWALVLYVMGGKLGHGTEWWKAILAYFLPTILCCCLLAWLASLFGFLGAIAD